MSFFTRLEARTKVINSLLCVGLDPHPDEFTTFSRDTIYSYCIRLVEATYEVAAAFKPNIAFFEILGSDGFDALEKVIAYISNDIPVILDAKRGDISSTAEAYAIAVFETFGVSAVTINPYLGYEALEPFLVYSDRGIFILCKTSNPGASDLQEVLLQSGEMLFERVVRLALAWNQFNNLGLVVGATYPDSLKRVRSLASNMWILAPGIGAQGASVQAVLKAGLRADGLGLLLPVSRGISKAHNPNLAAIELRDMINQERQIINH